MICYFNFLLLIWHSSAPAVWDDCGQCGLIVWPVVRSGRFDRNQRKQAACPCTAVSSKSEAACCVAQHVRRNMAMTTWLAGRSVGSGKPTENPPHPSPISVWGPSCSMQLQLLNSILTSSFLYGHPLSHYGRFDCVAGGALRAIDRNQRKQAACPCTAVSSKSEAAC